MEQFEQVTKRFWMDYPRYINQSHKCSPLPGGGHCLFNTDNQLSDAILYCGSYTKLNFKRMFNEQIVVVFTRESEKGEFCHFPPPDKYDIKVSYRRDSTIPLPIFCDGNHLLKLVEMGQPKIPVGRKKLVAALISNCYRATYKWRADYIRTLMKYIHVDQWGACFKNTPGGFWKNRRTPSYEELKLDLLNKNGYKFLIAFENTVEDEYVTEKVYDGYLTRTIPIYYGDKAVFDFIPSNNSLIYANQYSPKELAELIKNIAGNDTAYSEYFKNWDLMMMRKLHEQYCSEGFVCAICRKVWEILYNKKCDGK